MTAVLREVRRESYLRALAFAEGLDAGLAAAGLRHPTPRQRRLRLAIFFRDSWRSVK